MLTAEQKKQLQRLCHSVALARLNKARAGQTLNTFPFTREKQNYYDFCVNEAKASVDNFNNYLESL